MTAEKRVLTSRTLKKSVEKQDVVVHSRAARPLSAARLTHPSSDYLLALSDAEASELTGAGARLESFPSFYCPPSRMAASTMSKHPLSALRSQS